MQNDLVRLSLLVEYRTTPEFLIVRRIGDKDVVYAGRKRKLRGACAVRKPVDLDVGAEDVATEKHVQSLRVILFPAGRSHLRQQPFRRFRGGTMHEPFVECGGIGLHLLRSVVLAELNAIHTAYRFACCGIRKIQRKAHLERVRYRRDANVLARKLLDGRRDDAIGPKHPAYLLRGSLGHFFALRGSVLIDAYHVVRIHDTQRLSGKARGQRVRKRRHRQRRRVRSVVLDNKRYPARRGGTGLAPRVRWKGHA